MGRATGKKFGSERPGGGTPPGFRLRGWLPDPTVEVTPERGRGWGGGWNRDHAHCGEVCRNEKGNVILYSIKHMSKFVKKVDDGDGAETGSKREHEILPRTVPQREGGKHFWSWNYQPESSHL